MPWSPERRRKGSAAHHPHPAAEYISAPFRLREPMEFGKCGPTGAAGKKSNRGHLHICCLALLSAIEDTLNLHQEIILQPNRICNGNLSEREW